MTKIDLTQEELDVLFDILHTVKGSGYRTRRRYVESIVFGKLYEYCTFDSERSADIIGRVEFVEDIGGSKGMRATEEEIERMGDYWS